MMAKVLNKSNHRMIKYYELLKVELILLTALQIEEKMEEVLKFSLIFKGLVMMILIIEIVTKKRRI